MASFLVFWDCQNTVHRIMEICFLLLSSFLLPLSSSSFTAIRLHQFFFFAVAPNMTHSENTQVSSWPFVIFVNGSACFFAFPIVLVERKIMKCSHANDSSSHSRAFEKFIFRICRSTKNYKKIKLKIEGDYTGKATSLIAISFLIFSTLHSLLCDSFAFTAIFSNSLHPNGPSKNVAAFLYAFRY